MSELRFQDDPNLIIVAGADGRIIDQNKSAEKEFGHGKGKFCWDVMGKLQNTDSLPCQTGCVYELLGGSLNSSRTTQIKQEGIRKQLTCIPTSSTVVCVVSTTATGTGANKAADSTPSLSPREIEVLHSIANGDTTADTAKLLGVNQSTVRTHVERIFSKLNVKTRAAVVAEGFRLGYLD